MSLKALTQLLGYPSWPVKALLSSLLLLYWISTSPFDAVTYYLPNSIACTCMCQWVWRRADNFLFQHLIVQPLIPSIRFVGDFRICAVEVKHLSDGAILSRGSGNGCDIDYETRGTLQVHHGKISIKTVAHADVWFCFGLRRNWICNIPGRWRKFFV